MSKPGPLPHDTRSHPLLLSHPLDLSSNLQVMAQWQPKQLPKCATHCRGALVLPHSVHLISLPAVSATAHTLFHVSLFLMHPPQSPLYWSYGPVSIWHLFSKTLQICPLIILMVTSIFLAQWQFFPKSFWLLLEESITFHPHVTASTLFPLLMQSCQPCWPHRTHQCASITLCQCA